MLVYASRLREAQITANPKEFERILKKFLTNPKGYANIAKLLSEQQAIRNTSNKFEKT